MSILIPGTEKLAETVDIAVKWGSVFLTDKIVPAGTPLTAAGEVAVGASAAAVRGITAIDYGYSPYSNSCPCIVAGVVDMTKVNFRGGANQYAICAALDQISFIDANKKVYHPPVVSQIENGSITADKLAPGVLPVHFIGVDYAYIEDDVVVPTFCMCVFTYTDSLETGSWADLLAPGFNPVYLDGSTPKYMLTADEEGNMIVFDEGLFGYNSNDGTWDRMTLSTDIAGFDRYVAMDLESGE